MTTITKEQVDGAIKELDMAAGIADTFHVRNCCAALDNVEAYIAQLEKRVKVLEDIAQLGIAYVLAAQQGINFTKQRMIDDVKLFESALAGGKVGA